MKKVLFRVSVLPIVKLISSFFVHLFFVALIFVIFAIYGFRPSIYNIQFLYYTFCMVVLLLGLTCMTSAIIPFFKDLGQIIMIILQVGMWATPIVWPANMLPPKLAWFFKLNPMYYIVEGYRDSFLNNVWFFHRYNQTIFFWVITIVILISGATIFRKLRPHFSDVL